MSGRKVTDDITSNTSGVACFWIPVLSPRVVLNVAKPEILMALLLCLVWWSVDARKRCSGLLSLGPAATHTRTLSCR